MHKKELMQEGSIGRGEDKRKKDNITLEGSFSVIPEAAVDNCDGPSRHLVHQHALVSRGLHHLVLDQNFLARNVGRGPDTVGSDDIVDADARRLGRERGKVEGDRSGGVAKVDELGRCQAKDRKRRRKKKEKKKMSNRIDHV